jgi:hypothetical protein
MLGKPVSLTVAGRLLLSALVEIVAVTFDYERCLFLDAGAVAEIVIVDSKIGTPALKLRLKLHEQP